MSYKFQSHLYHMTRQMHTAMAESWLCAGGLWCTIIGLVLVLGTPASAQIIVAPPSPNDFSCTARATRMYPWASQYKQRVEMTETLCLRDQMLASPPSNNQTCITTRTDATTTTICK